MATRIQLRKDTSANWASTNPILAQGEIGVDITSGFFKVGDGSTAWNSLEFPKEVAATASGTDTYSVTYSPAPIAYVSGKAYLVKFTNANTGAATINFNSLGTKSIKKKAAGWQLLLFIRLN